MKNIFKSVPRAPSSLTCNKYRFLPLRHFLCRHSLINQLLDGYEATQAPVTEGESSMDWVSTRYSTSHAVIFWRPLYWWIQVLISHISYCWCLLLIPTYFMYSINQHVLSAITPIKVTWLLRLPSPNGNAKIGKIQPIATSSAFPTSRKTRPEKTPEKLRLEYLP